MARRVSRASGGEWGTGTKERRRIVRHSDKQLQWVRRSCVVVFSKQVRRCVRRRLVSSRFLPDVLRAWGTPVI